MSDRRRTIRRAISIASYVLCGVLLLLALVQEFSGLHLLDDPWTGAVGFFLIGLLTTRFGRRGMVESRPEPPDDPPPGAH